MGKSRLGKGCVVGLSRNILRLTQCKKTNSGTLTRSKGKFISGLRTCFEFFGSIRLETKEEVGVNPGKR